MGARVESATRSLSSNMNMMSNEEFEGNTKVIRTFETSFRLAPVGLCVAALVIMLKNSQENDYGSVSYSDLGSFRYLVQANGICACYSILSVGIVALSHPSTMLKAWTFFLLDQVQTYLILTAGAASMEVLYIAKNGNTATTWSSACGSFGSFCHKGTISLALTFVAVFCYVMLSLISSYKLFSKYDAPPIITTPTNNATNATNATNDKDINMVASHG